MIISRTALMILTFFVLISVFVANVVNVLTVETITTDRQRNEYKNELLSQDKIIADKADHIMWFLQVSDLHISMFHDPSRITELREYCDTTVEAIKPTVVIASGDLTDAKTKDHIGSKQFEKEWQYYYNVLNECKANKKTIWLDIRGNHDNFNVATIDSKQNFYLNYSMQGRLHPKSYMHQVNKNGDLYTFIGLDACLDPGPRRPFNFVGLLKDQDVTELNLMAQEAVKNGSNYIIWFGHFPTSCILASGQGGIRSVIAKQPQGLVYLCGHLHQLGGIVPNMYTRQQAGFLELELGDWKDNRMYRLAAIDHGLFSFVDIKFRDWPIALVTNPKHALFVIPDREPLHYIKKSTHIRVLAFSLSKVISVRVKIDNGDWKQCKNVKGPLYVAEWNPNEYMNGVHNIQVNVIDEDGREKNLNQPFALDDSRLSFNILAKILLMTHASYVFQFMYGVMVFICVVPLCTFRILHKLVKDGKMKRPRVKNNCLRKLLKKYWILSTVDRLFYPLILYPIYLSFGPWSVGYIIEDHIGVIFIWGIFVRGAYLPGSFTYLYGFIQLVIFQIPIIVIFATYLESKSDKSAEKKFGKPRVVWNFIVLHLPFLIILLLQIIFAYFFWLAYSTLATVFSPLRFWSIILMLALWYQTLKLPDKFVREGLFMWSQKDKDDSEETN